MKPGIPASLLDDVAEAVVAVADAAIVPRFRALVEGDVSEKAPGEIFTIADVEAERMLTERLGRLLPGVPVVGEEAVAADPTLLGALSEARCWIVDPIDGTSTFVAGQPGYAVMVALVDGGDVVRSWIHQPATGEMLVAARNQGAWLDGNRLDPGAPREPSRCLVKTHYFVPELRARIEAGLGRFTVAGDVGSAGIAYGMLARGEVDFLLYNRILPWDHAPGVLLAEESGAVAHRFDGSPYRVGDDRLGLLVASDDAGWQVVREALLP